jgi:hypothetical protein
MKEYKIIEFAFIPTPLNNGKWVWLDYYIAVKVMVTNYITNDTLITIRREPLTR